jgi:predicted negative regulator of RcsB-dependent stress response
MSVYMTEEEQLDAIKKWWQRYSTLLLVIFSIVLLSVSAYRYWQYHQLKVNTEASNAYEHLMVAFANQDQKAANAYANQLTSDFGQTIYAQAARLALAKLYVSDGNYDKAMNNLEVVANASTMKALKQVARIRMARLLALKKSYEPAMTQLNSVDDTAYLPLVNELKGDIYAATGEYQKAMLAYQEAIKGVRSQGIGNMYLEMKSNELAALSGVSKQKNDQETQYS